MTVSPPSAAIEAARLRALAEYRLLDTPETKDFDRLANLASSLFEVPIVLVSLVASDRQFFKAHVGLEVRETGREISFCSRAIEQDEVFCVLDALHDDRFSTNPMVIGPPFVRFYAGKPLVTPTGEKIGTVCLIDTKPRSSFDARDCQNLSDLAALVMDRIEMHRLEHVKTVSQARFENIAATSPDAIICTNSESLITFWNRSAERLFGYTSREIEHQSVSTIVPDSWRVIFETEVARLRNGEALELANQTIELSGLHRDGNEFPAEFSFSTWDEGGTTSVGAIVRDITERRHNEERLFRMASLDALTELPNRAALRDCMLSALADGQPATVFLLDLDSFKEVNDTLGHSAGDAVLKEVAARLRATCPGATMVARLGGDEFVALLPGNDLRLAKQIAARLVEAIAAPFQFAGQFIEIGGSIGLALAPTDGSRSEELLGAADLALYRAKAGGKGQYEVFEASFREVAIARRSFERELRTAFENGEFELFYQPQVATQTRRIIGAEALMRWHHPTRGLLSPASFMDVLSAKTSASDVGEWTLRTACLDATVWQRRTPNFRVSVNLFEAQLRSERLLGAVRNALDTSGLPAKSLELEIVENTLLRNDAKTIKILHDIRNLGVGLAFDDYGTGFASLSLLKRFPVSRLKIDQEFIRNIIEDAADAAVVKAIIYLGKSFGLEVIAEGVETEEQLAYLLKSHCTQAQGYLFGLPVCAEAFHELLVNAGE